MTTFVNGLSDCYDDLVACLTGSSPVFISRIGGSDTDAVVDYLRTRALGADELRDHISRHMPRVSKFNGFYDRSFTIESYLDYCECLFECYFASQRLLFCNYQLLSVYFPEALNSQFRRDQFPNREGYISLVDEICLRVSSLRCYPYKFVERMFFEKHTMFWAFAHLLQGKKVLVVCPFAESIVENFPHRQKFFKEPYVYPEFMLELVNSPITYAGLPPEMYPHKNWFETLDHLKKEVAGKDFDIALLSCGSYAMPLGVHIERVLKRKAVYVGGILQLYFGVMGRRYENPWFADQINLEYFIYPLERERYLRYVTISENAAKEAFGAYF